MSLYPESIARCQHLKVNGTQCGSPALRKQRFCYFHKDWRQKRLQINVNIRREQGAVTLPVLEDANSIQVALMQVMRLLITAQIEHRTAGLLLYALQTASANLARTTFEPKLPTQVVIDRATISRRVSRARTLSATFITANAPRVPTVNSPLISRRWYHPPTIVHKNNTNPFLFLD